MTSLVREFGNGGTSNSLVTNAPANLLVGQTVYAAIIMLGSSVSPVISIEDSAGNTWVIDIPAADITGQTNRTALAHSVLTNQISSGATITVSGSTTVTRSAVSFLVFADPVSLPATTTTGQTAASAGSFSTSSYSPPSSNTLHVAAVGFVNSGRILTPGGGFTAATKVITGGTSGFRAIQAFWKETSSVGSSTFSATSNSGGQFAFGVAALALDTEEPPAEIYHYWDGAAWAPLTDIPEFWNGSSWVVSEPHYWNGSAWIPL